MPRMWMVDVATLCNKHLIAEHHELHVICGNLNRKRDAVVLGLVKRGSVELLSIRTRHDEVALELLRRGFDHRSELPAFRYPTCTSEQLNRRIDREVNILTLEDRCHGCALLIQAKRDGRKRTIYEEMGDV
jgi:Pyrimidine dimer DNA glycosylase